MAAALVVAVEILITECPFRLSLGANTRLVVTVILLPLLIMIYRALFRLFIIITFMVLCIRVKILATLRWMDSVLFDLAVAADVFFLYP